MPLVTLKLKDLKQMQKLKAYYHPQQMTLIPKNEWHKYEFIIEDHIRELKEHLDAGWGIVYSMKLMGLPSRSGDLLKAIKKHTEYNDIYDSYMQRVYAKKLNSSMLGSK